MKKIGYMAMTLVFIMSVFCQSGFAANRYIDMTLTYDYSKHRYNAEEVFVAIDGNKLTDLQMPPIILNNYTLVPAREVFEAIGANVDWKKEIEQVYITYEDKLVVIPINSGKAYINGVAAAMQTNAKIINNKTMIPLRFVSTAVGLDIEWNDSTRIANIVTAIEQTTEYSEPTTEEITEAPTEAVTEPQTEAPTETQTEATTAAPVEVTTVKTTTSYEAQPEGDGVYIDASNEFVVGSVNSVNIKSIEHNDDYNNLVYTITIPGNYTSTLTGGTYSINNDYINTINVNVNTNKTVITVNENRILAFDVYTNNGSLIVKPVLPKDKYSKIIVLDAGHGGDDPGASGQGLIEKDLTLSMLLKSKELFDNDGTIKCYVTRNSDTYPSYDDRTNLANEVGDAFISIHINSASNPSALGTETYAYKANDTGSGLTSQILAQELLDNLLTNLGTVNRKVKSENFIVLRQSNIPASLIEIGFISNASDAQLMNSEEGQQAVAEAVFTSVKNLFNTYTPVR